MGIEGVDAYPLYWPLDWKRTLADRRVHGRYQVNFGRARDEVLNSVRLLKGREVVISSNVPIRRDGLPYANMPEPKDPGIAVYWLTAKRETRVMACDSWRTVRDNLRAIGLALEGLRAIERSGASQVLERAFAGFTALPADASASSWRTVLGLDGGAVTRDVIEEAYRRRAVAAHPDAGGSHGAMVALNAAREQALREMGRG